MKSLLSLLEIVFKGIYLFITFFIVIGEITQKFVIFIFSLPVMVFKYIGSFFKYLTKFLFDFISRIINTIFKIHLHWPKIHIKIPDFTYVKNATKLPKRISSKRLTIHIPKIHVSLAKIALPRLRISLPKISVKLPTFGIIATKVRYFVLGVLITLFVVAGYQGYLFVKNLPEPKDIGKVNYALSSHIYDRNGKLLYEIYREQNRTPITLKELPPYVYQATVAIEDKDFYKHNGISLVSGIFRAIRDMITEKNLQGGSTITQQLVKTALLTPDRTIQRKVKEIILALWTEQLFTKDQILEMYLNQVPYGGSSYGIQEAAKVYFGKDAKDLTLDEAALLAGLPQAPSLYSPNINPTLALERRNEVLKAMKDQAYIDNNTFMQSSQKSLTIIPPKTEIKAPHFVFYLKSKLESLYGIKAVEEEGLKVISTLDLDIQEQSEKILKEELAKIQNLNVTNGGILVTRPSTGEILAMVGSVDYFALPSGAFNVTTALRQPGSSIKPVMYSLALQKGYTAASIIDDSPVVFNSQGGESYKPVNYDGKFHGKVPLRYALANSYNIPAVKTLNSIGVQNFIDHARKMGISTWGDSSRYGLSLTLGGGEVTMVDMATAFGVLANSGYKMTPTSYQKIEDVAGNVIREYDSYKTRVLDEGISFIISDILSDNFARQWAFGPHSELEIPGYQVAVKTGTTDSKKDNWTIGYTPDFLVVVWVGNNNNQPMNPYLSSGITGAAPIWNRVMAYLLKNYSSGNHWYSVPDDVVSKKCYYGRTEYFISGTESKAACSESLLGTTPTPTPQYHN